MVLLTSILWQRVRAPRLSGIPNSAINTWWNLSCSWAVKRNLLNNWDLEAKDSCSLVAENNCSPKISTQTHSSKSLPLEQKQECSSHSTAQMQAWQVRSESCGACFSSPRSRGEDGTPQDTQPPHSPWLHVNWFVQPRHLTLSQLYVAYLFSLLFERW